MRKRRKTEPKSVPTCFCVAVEERGRFANRGDIKITLPIVIITTVKSLRLHTA